MASGYNEDLRFDVLDASSGVQGNQDTSNTTPLQESCRTKIIKSVGLQRLARASELPIPQTMVDVLMEHLTVDDFFINRNHVSGEHVNNNVYPGKCILDNTDVVLKCIPPCLASKDQTMLANQWTGLNHPNLMQYLAQFSQGGTQVIVFERYPHVLSEILYERQSKSKPIPQRLLWRAFAELCTVLKFLVDNQVSYDNLNPEKIAFDKDGVLKLDSGILHTVDPSGMPMAMEGPDAIYTPPEVLEGQQYSANSHVWVLGCMLLELATLQPAFPISDGNMFGAMSGVMKGNPSGIERLDEKLRDVVKRCLLKDPEGRADISELLEEAKSEMERSGSTDEKLWDFSS